MDPVAALLRDLVRGKTGIHVDDYGLDIFMEKMSTLAVERGFPALLDYYYLLKYDAAGESEWQHVVDAISVRETYFFREADQIRALVDTVIPEHFSKKKNEPFRIWSAACASGEEPLTIAIAIEEAGLSSLPISIAASDVSPAAIRTAQAGVYRERSFRNIPDFIRSKYFTSQNGAWRVNRNIHERIQWSNANLVEEREVAALAAAHVIFCRNVFIYFNVETIRKVVGMFAARMKDPAYLFLGAPESLLRITGTFELKEIDRAFVYVRAREAGKDGSGWTV